MTKKKKTIEKKRSEEVKKIPTGVKIISILYYIAIGFCVILALAFIISSGYIDSALPGLNGAGKGMFILLGVAILGMGVVSFFIGRGLWRLKPWARIVAIVFSALGVLSAVFSLISGNIADGIVNLIIMGLIGYYLLLDKEVQEVFKERK